jgi:hypothetical protein
MTAEIMEQNATDPLCPAPLATDRGFFFEPAVSTGFLSTPVKVTMVMKSLLNPTTLQVAKQQKRTFSPESFDETALQVSEIVLSKIHTAQEDQNSTL